MLLPHLNLFLKKDNKTSRTNIPSLFFPWFLKKISLLLYSINWSNFIGWLPVLLEILGNMWVVAVCQAGCGVTNFKNSHIFLIKPFFLHDQKFKTKVWISWEWKKFLRLSKKQFSLILKSFYWTKNFEFPNFWILNNIQTN